MGKSEEWKQIKDFPNYYISNKGRVASNGMKQGNKVYGFRILKPLDNGSGYLKVHIRTPKGIKKSKYVHRLVAEAFIDNQSNKPCINHIDNNPLNNCVENIEWCTPLENFQHMQKQGRNKRTDKWIRNLKTSLERIEKPVIGTHVSSGEQIKFKSVNSVKEYGFEPSCVSNCCNKKRKTHKGYTWEFETL